MPLSKFFGAVRGVGVFCLAWRTFVLPSKIVEHVNGFVAFPVNQLAFHVACQAPRSRAIPALVRSYVGKDTETPSSSPDLSPASASFRVIVGWNPAGAKNIKPGAAVRPIGGASRRSY